MINENYLIKVKDLPAFLPTPRLRKLNKPMKKEDRAETLNELPIITVVCELNEI